jgi:fido (protein-threonine AMPylation protein)
MPYLSFADFPDWTAVTVDGELWDSYLSRLDARRAAVGPVESDHGVRRGLLAAAVNTGAIEGLHGAGRGLTETAIAHALDWQGIVREQEGHDAEQYIAAALDAFDLALDAATRGTPLSEAWLRRVHEVACAPQRFVDVWVDVGRERRRQEQVFTKGRYKQHPNHVRLPDGSLHEYSPVDRVADEVQRLLAHVRSAPFDAAHPVLQAAYVHHALTAIHPFQDGNGRVARVVASVFLLRGASIPLLVYADQAAAYFDALAAADAGDVAPFVDFVFQRAVGLLALTTDLLGSELAPNGQRLVLRLPQDRVAPVLVDAAKRVSLAVDVELAEAVTQVELGTGIEMTRSTMGFTLGAMDRDDRVTVTDTHPFLRIRAESLGQVVDRWFPVFVSLDGGAQFPIAVRLNADQDALELRTEDVHPEITTFARQRIRAFVRRTVAEAVEDFSRKLR